MADYKKLIVPAIVVAALVALALWSGCPNPSPTPTPDPDPVPPVKGDVGILVVHQSENQTPERFAILGGPWRKLVTDAGLRFLIVDADSQNELNQVPPGLVVWIDRAVGKMPCVFIFSDGKLKHEGPLPDTPAAMLALVSKHIGG